MTRKKMAANRKGIGPTTLKRACNSTTNERTKYLLIVMHKTLCSVWLTFIRRENETVQYCPIVLKGTHRGSFKKSEKICVARWDYAIHKSSFSELSIIIILLLFLIRCNSQTTQATELTQTRTQIAPPILQSSPNKEGTRHGII